MNFGKDKISKFPRWPNSTIFTSPENKAKRKRKKAHKTCWLVKSQCLHVLHFYCSPCWAANSKHFSSVKRFSFTLRLLNLELNFFANVLVLAHNLLLLLLACTSHVLFCEFICVIVGNLLQNVNEWSLIWSLRNPVLMHDPLWILIDEGNGLNRCIKI